MLYAQIMTFLSRESIERRDAGVAAVSTIVSRCDYCADAIKRSNAAKNRAPVAQHVFDTHGDSRGTERRPPHQVAFPARSGKQNQARVRMVTRCEETSFCFCRLAGAARKRNDRRAVNAGLQSGLEFIRQSLLKARQDARSVSENSSSIVRRPFSTVQEGSTLPKLCRVAKASETSVNCLSARYGLLTSHFIYGIVAKTSFVNGLSTLVESTAVTTQK